MAVAGAVAMTPEARRSFEEFERKAEAGDPQALYRLSAILEKGYDSIAPDTVRSLSLLRRSANLGYAPAQNYLGFLFQKGLMVRQNPDSAAHYIRMAADAGDATAAHNLAYMILMGETEREDPPTVETPDLAPDAKAEAMAYLQKAVDAGLPQSQTLLADIYAAQGDTVPAIDLYEKAIAHGFHDAELRLLNLMGPIWIATLDDEAALREGIRYWNLGAPTIAVELLHLVGPESPQTAQTYALLGHAYSRGQGAPYDHRRANEYFARAALLGNPSAQFIFAETLGIFPDALAELLPDLPDSMTPDSLLESARRAGISTAEQATQALLQSP